jgi:hypothetical protein
LSNKVDYIRAGNNAPRTAAGVAALEGIPPGQIFGYKSLREYVMERTDLADKTVQNLIGDAISCEKPILKKFTIGGSVRYMRATD